MAWQMLAIHIARSSLRHRRTPGAWSASDVPVARQTIASRDAENGHSALAHVARK
ncbi:MAG: hypothetical protein ACLRP3_11965 [Escherichia sp.]